MALPQAMIGDQYMVWATVACEVALNALIWPSGDCTTDHELPNQFSQVNSPVNHCARKAIFSEMNISGIFDCTVHHWCILL